ncbi:hypothetical protein [Neisseria sp. Ec49-e6-T10]|uniref:hypothetical protein n=1 Tax=Neisseria sp. Ec49-e6-T10 TaxID=3140744 RepID=UPI003EC0A1FE
MNNLIFRTQQELDALATDPAHGNKGVDKKGIAEREVGLALEAKGEVCGLIRDPSGLADFIDQTGQKWDVKGFRSQHSVEKYSLEMALAHIQKSIDQNEYVMLDTREMVEHDIQELTNELIHRGLINKVKIWP